ncbi:MAG: primosomal protein N' [Acidobacteria bacterium]|nr:primosomal protein N' [Acidobacteriota bacterium]
MPQFCEVALPVPLDLLFYYSVPDSATLRPGVRVIVPFGKRKLLGVVVRCGVEPKGIEETAIKPIQQVLEEEPALSEEMLRLGHWISDYYVVPEGETLAALLPPKAPVQRKTQVVLTQAGQEALRSALSEEHSSSVTQEEAAILQRIARRGGIRRQTLRDSARVLERLRRRGWVAYESSLQPRAPSSAAPLPEWESEPLLEGLYELTHQQKEALDGIRQQMETGRFGVVLLHGITGSGKTEIYLRAIEAALERQRPALVLVPEISLTPAIAELFVRRLGSHVAVLHSGLAEGEREAQWQRVRSGHCPVVLGTRSAVFAPLERPALIIVDEEHDTSYKQEEAPRYHGRDVAIVRAREANATVVLGSATPAIESRYNAETGKYQLLELDRRVRERPLPETEIVDMRKEFAETGQQTFFSRSLQEQIARRLEQREQALILLNRRGYSVFVLCRSCGQTIQCHNCSIALAHHRRPARLLCHYCGFARPVPQVCPACDSEYLYFVGEGSERVEDALRQRFPEARIGRLDRDTARGRGRAEAILAAFRNHELDILVGTQMIAKGHDIHRVTLVGVINADVGLARPDFRSAERTFQLLTQVAGRAGRGELPGEVIIQTYYPEHYAIRSAAAQDYGLFYPQELRFRQIMHYPPFAALANILVKSPSAETALKLTGRLGRQLEVLQSPGWKLLGPAAAPVHRLKRDYRYHFLIKASRRSLLHDLLISCREFAYSEAFPAGSLILDVDPQSLF